MTLAAHPRRGKKARRGERKDLEPALGASFTDREPRAGALLAWYDRHRRVLPWRAMPAQKPDAYRVWLSEIMLQQTTVKAVAPYFVRFIARWPDVRALAQAPLHDVLRLWAGLGYYARARNLHACARVVVERHGGEFPRSEAQLSALPGIGAYTAAAIAAIAFDVRAAAMDANAERVLARLFAVKTALPAGKPRLRQLAESLLPDKRAGDFAQALMDLGATICTPKKPACALCPWAQGCIGCKRGEPEAFPRKAEKRQGELRRGAAFVLKRSDNAVLLRRRPPHGLLGGMEEVPTTEWSRDFAEGDALAQAPRPPSARPQWRRLPGHVAHAFTHFPLQLRVYAACVTSTASAPEGMRWVAIADLGGEALPAVMRKVLAHALRPQAASPTR